MTPKYLQNEINRLKALRAGILANQVQWNGLPVTIEQIDAALLVLQAAADEMSSKEIAFKKLQETSHTIADTQALIGNQVENLAKGIHANEPEKLLDYGINKRKASVAGAVPAKAAITNLNDGADGEGFVLSIQSLENATDFEIWRGVGTTSDTLALEPDQFNFLSVTKKLTFTDEDVVKGTRYFYRLRGFNYKGKGEWSLVASRVQ